MSKIITTEQALREALVDEISVAAAMSGPCQEGLMPRCRCFKCRRGRSIAALALPAPEVTLEYRVGWEELTGYGESERWHQNRRNAAGIEAAILILNGWRSRSPFCFRNIHAECREVHIGPWLPVVKP